MKKTTDGVWLYFAHNTDSFVSQSFQKVCLRDNFVMLTSQAMASMSSEESKPRSLMSRNKGDSKVISGGRSIKHHRLVNWSAPQHSTWPANPDHPGSLEQPAKRQKRKRIPPTGLTPEFETDELMYDNDYKEYYEATMREIRKASPAMAEKSTLLTSGSRSSCP